MKNRCLNSFFMFYCYLPSESQQPSQLFISSIVRPWVTQRNYFCTADLNFLPMKCASFLCFFTYNFPLIILCKEFIFPLSSHGSKIATLLFLFWTNFLSVFQFRIWYFLYPLYLWNVPICSYFKRFHAFTNVLLPYKSVNP